MELAKYAYEHRTPEGYHQGLTGDLAPDNPGESATGGGGEGAQYSGGGGGAGGQHSVDGGSGGVGLDAGSSGSGGGKYDDILRPGGSPLCDPGSSERIRECPGGDEEAQNLTSDLVERGNGYPYQDLPDGGAVYENPGDGYVTYRPESKSGPPTVDPNLNGYDDIRKVKFVGNNQY